MTAHDPDSRSLKLDLVALAILLACGLWFLSPAFAAGDFSTGGIGLVGAQELNLPVGARGIAMGEAMTAVADDVTAIHWNPAGLAAVPTGSASFMHSVYLDNISYQYAAYAHRVGEREVMAVSVQAVDFGSIERRDVNNIADGSFHPRSMLYSFGYAQNVHELEEGGDLSAGFTARWLRSTIVSSADSYGLDFGFRVKETGDIPSQLAFVAQNLGSGPKFDTQREKLPFQMKGATAFYPGAWVLSFELVAPRGNQPYAAAGVEYKRGWTRTMTGSLRAGYNSMLTAGGPGGLHGPSLGVGVELTGFSFDYAIVPFGDLGITHQLSINYNLPTFEED
jgi:hypothetical protein